MKLEIQNETEGLLLWKISEQGLIRQVKQYEKHAEKIHWRTNMLRTITNDAINKKRKEQINDDIANMNARKLNKFRMRL